ncbi:MAG: aspartate-semialdehyde dehydrogenase [Chitinispirillia bacterium]|jgi:aspartate-semialdehyde dehydrogenase
MSERIPVGILGATGVVGQNYVRLLQNHPWFEITYLAASPSSAGKSYTEAVQGRWHMPDPIPENVASLTVGNANLVNNARGKCALVFSAINLDKKTTAALEFEYAEKGFAVMSNNSAHRATPDVPMILPEINSDHLEIIPFQRMHYSWKKGCIVVKSNCSIQSYLSPLYALINNGYPIDRLIVTNLEAVSGAGYPGPSSMDIIDNIIPFINGEEEKSEHEPLKIFGSIGNERIVPAVSPVISAHCNRIPVIDGHTSCISMKFSDTKPSHEEIVSIWKNFSSAPQKLNLPSAPFPPIVYRDEPDRPQPRKDRDIGNGMAITVGRLRPCPVFDYRFVGLHHNTVRGAAGGCILSAELLKSMDYLE